MVKHFEIHGGLGMLQELLLDAQLSKKAQDIATKRHGGICASKTNSQDVKG